MGSSRNTGPPVGASMLAMDVNDDAGILDTRGAFEIIVGTPPGACSLLQGKIRKKNRLFRGGFSFSR
ncbi:hypothetical protein DM828_23585 [Pseudomonas umsongensis]|nr:hypothetical protein [Pseudomonas umsongensis]